MPYSAAISRPASAAVTMVIFSRGMSMWRRIRGRTPWPMLPKPTMTRRPLNLTCFIFSSPSSQARGFAAGPPVPRNRWLQSRCSVEDGLHARRRQHWTVAHLDEAGAVEAVERRTQAGAVGAELADLHEVALADVVRQRKRPLHAVSRVAGRAPQLERRRRRRACRSPGADQAHREAEAGHAGIRQAAVDAVVDVERVAPAQLDLHDHRGARADDGAAGLGPEPRRRREAEGGEAGLDLRHVGPKRRRRHVRIADREAAADIDDVDRDAGAPDR